MMQVKALHLLWITWALPVALAACGSPAAPAPDTEFPSDAVGSNDTVDPAADATAAPDAGLPSDVVGSSDTVDPAADAVAPPGDAWRDVDVPTDPEPDPPSRWECFGGTMCDQGTVTRVEAGEQPAGDNSCGVVEAVVCKEGCAPFLHRRLDEDDLASYCRENVHLPAVGDACSTSAECIWPHAPYFWNGVLQNIYLDCVDAACAEAPAVTIADFGHPCTLTPGAVVEASTECVGGLCARGKDYLGQCTGPCTGDHECPPSWGCEVGVIGYCL